MIDTTEDEGEGVDWELFGLEFEYAVETRIKPALRTALQKSQDAFDLAMNARPEVQAEAVRWALERADYARRRERQAYVTAQQAKLAAKARHARPDTRIGFLAQGLAMAWKAGFVRNERLSARQHNNTTKD